jgi:protein AFG1
MVIDYQKVLIASFQSSLQNLFNGKDKKDKHHYENSNNRLLFDDLKLTTSQLKISIFTGEEEVFAFKRAISRLIEMQGLPWVGENVASKINAVLTDQLYKFVIF